MIGESSDLGHFELFLPHNSEPEVLIQEIYVTKYNSTDMKVSIDYLPEFKRHLLESLELKSRTRMSDINADNLSVILSDRKRKARTLQWDWR